MSDWHAIHYRKRFIHSIACIQANQCLLIHFVAAAGNTPSYQAEGFTTICSQGDALDIMGRMGRC
jgi:hypothetical protein